MDPPNTMDQLVLDADAGPVEDSAMCWTKLATVEEVDDGPVEDAAVGYAKAAKVEDADVGPEEDANMSCHTKVAKLEDVDGGPVVDAALYCAKAATVEDADHGPEEDAARSCTKTAMLEDGDGDPVEGAALCCTEVTTVEVVDGGPVEGTDVCWTKAATVTNVDGGPVKDAPMYCTKAATVEDVDGGPVEGDLLYCTKAATVVNVDSGPVEDANVGSINVATGPPTGARDDGGAIQQLRMIGDVLVEPRQRDAPTKRRRGKAKRSTCPKIQGTLKDYFAKIPVPKEIRDENSTVEGAPMRKRKGEDLMLEDPKQHTGSKELLCPLMENDEKICGLASSRTLCPIIWGAKSVNGRETDDGQTGRSGNGLELFSLAPMRKKLAGDWTNDDTRNI